MLIENIKKKRKRLQKYKLNKVKQTGRRRSSLAELIHFLSNDQPDSNKKIEHFHPQV